MRYSDYSKTERTRQHIIEKVAPVFNKKGYAATSMSDLISATGLSKGSIYGNFKNKDEVALRAFEYNLGFINKTLRGLIQQEETGRGKLLVYPRAFKTISRTVLANGGCPLINTSVDADDLNKLLHQAVSEAIMNWQTAILKIIERGKEKGEWPDDTDGLKIAHIMISLVEGGFAMSKATGDEGFLHHCLEELERVIESL